MTKQELIEQIIPHQQYVGSKIREWITDISNTRDQTPSVLKKGDVFTSFCGVKKRPCVITKVKNGIVFAIPLTSNENAHSLIKYNSRFLGEGWFCNTYIVATEEHVRGNFIGVFDGTKSLNEGIKALREYIKKNI